MFFMNQLTPDEIAAMHTGKIEMERDGQSWSDDEKLELITGYFSGMGITELAYRHKRTESAIMQQLIANHSMRNHHKSRSHYRKRSECQCYRCYKKCTPECPFFEKEIEKDV